MRTLTGWLCLAVVCHALAPVALACEPPKNAHEAAAEGAYGVALQRCVDKYDTAAEMDACADGVRLRWGVKDGGR